MRLIINAFLLLTALAALSCCFAESNMNDGALSSTQITQLTIQLQTMAIQVKQKFELPGLSIAVLLPNNKTPLLITSGNKQLSSEQPTTPETLFQVGSTTKTFTAELLAQALNNKTISLQDTLGKFFPEYPKWQEITIEQLANQTSGIFDYIDSKNWFPQLAATTRAHQVWDAKALVDIAYQHPNYFPAGSGWHYANTNYVLLGMILEKVNHQPLSVQMKTLIRKANLTHTYYLPTPYPTMILNRMAHGYGYYDQIYDMTDENGSWLQAAGAMVSTPEDLVKWMQKLFTDSLSTSLIQYLQMKDTTTGQPASILDQSSYSFALFRMNTPEGLVWFTPGLTSGYITGMVYAPCQNIYFAYSTNKAPVAKLQGYLMMTLLHTLKSNFHNSIIQNAPSYCSTLKPAAQFIFPLH